MEKPQRPQQTENKPQKTNFKSTIPKHVKVERYYMFDSLKSFEVNIEGDEWGMNILCDTFSQAQSITKALKFYYDHEKVEIECLEIEQRGEILEKII